MSKKNLCPNCFDSLCDGTCEDDLDMTFYPSDDEIENMNWMDSEKGKPTTLPSTLSEALKNS